MKKEYKSQRLEYQKVVDSHLEFFTEFLGSPVLTRYLPLGHPYPRLDIIDYCQKRIDHWRRKNFGTFIISTREGSEPVGYCGLEHVRDTDFIDIRYGIKKAFWGRGYGREAAHWCLAFGFKQLGLQTIYGAAEHGNIPSLTILKQLGMGSCCDVDFYGDVVQYFKITKAEYLKNECPSLYGRDS
ncbi:GNAT family N-acetyltransferase [Desulfopila sp. IMCC35008]|uniref:GNAT family N-acetyltransferase n=1 Tax=Desulfopila sp. IMCC35008 TaxID=2653858 RepID=UPI0013D48D0A|nr:GNAT family N-acetyltransferase [Desulfopila sp. IMCC35008]